MVIATFNSWHRRLGSTIWHDAYTSLRAVNIPMDARSARDRDFFASEVSAVLNETILVVEWPLSRASNANISRRESDGRESGCESKGNLGYVLEYL
jgi:hypothetical protein